MALPDVGKAIYEALRDDASVAALVGTRIFDSHVPAGFTLPYLHFTQVAGGDTNVAIHRDVNVVYQVTAVAEKQSTAKSIIDAAHDVLHKAALDVTDWSNYRTVAEGYRTAVDTYEGKQYFQRSFDVRVLVDKASA